VCPALMVTGRLRLYKGNFISPDFIFLLRDRCNTSSSPRSKKKDLHSFRTRFANLRALAVMAANCYQSCCCCYASLGALLLVLVTTCCSNAVAAAAVTDRECPEAIFSFGASTSDTGNIEAAFPFRVAPQTNPPYGETFFGRPANRYSDGRLIVDFFGTVFFFSSAITGLLSFLRLYERCKCLLFMRACFSWFHLCFLIQHKLLSFHFSVRICNPWDLTLHAESTLRLPGRQQAIAPWLALSISKFKPSSFVTSRREPWQCGTREKKVMFKLRFTFCVSKMKSLSYFLAERNCSNLLLSSLIDSIHHK
jgi:hypothetical protein